MITKYFTLFSKKLWVLMISCLYKSKDFINLVDKSFFIAAKNTIHQPLTQFLFSKKARQEKSASFGNEPNNASMVLKDVL